jgi:TPP-dependent pyruvate/acetoin dehydrogenase alpha subunit
MPSKSKQNTAAAGSVTSAPAESTSAQDGFSLISNQKLLQLYATMVKCRLLEERIRIERKRLQASGNVALPPRGREAGIAGVLMDTLSDDDLVTPPMDLISLFVQGMPLAKLFGFLRKGRPIPIASAVFSNEAKDEKRIRVVVSGGGDAEQRSWTEALRHASLHRPPTIFLCWKPRKTPAPDFPVMTVDACDVVAVYRVASESIAHARQGFGPTLIECQHWQRADATRNPLLNMEKYLDRKRLFNRATKAEITASFRSELDAAVRSANGKFPRSAPGI